jgi:hypothetical protein
MIVLVTFDIVFLLRSVELDEAISTRRRLRNPEVALKHG